MAWKLVWSTLIFVVLALVNIILDEICNAIPNASSRYIRVLCGASLDKK